MGFRFSPAFANMYYTRINTGDYSHRSFCAHVVFAHLYEELLSEIVRNFFSIPVTSLTRPDVIRAWFLLDVMIIPGHDFVEE